jgi:CBS domain-containing protein
MQVSEILRVKGNTLYTVGPDAMLSDAVITMSENDIGSIVVMEKGALLGLVTFREVMRVLAKRQSEHRAGPTPPVAEIRVRDVMNVAPSVATPTMDVNELRRSMVDSHQRYIPIMEESTLLGVISFHDVARAVLEEQSFENRMLKGYIKNWPGEQA